MAKENTHIKTFLPTLFLFIILLAALLLRSLFLDSIPHGFGWDEAGYAYNAYSLLKTGKDEWSQSFPIFLRSYDDFKPALYSYLLVPVFAIFGKSIAASRIVIGILSVISIFAFERFVYAATKKRAVSLTAAALMAITPWHIQFSRMAMADPMLSFSFLMIGCWLWMSDHPKVKALGAVSFILSMYTYNASRIFIPAIIGMYILIYHLRPSLTPFIKRYYAALIILFLGVCAVGYLMLFTVIGKRAKDVSIFKITLSVQDQINESMFRDIALMTPATRLFDNKIAGWVPFLAGQYMSHFSPKNLFISDTQNTRHSFPLYGNLLIICAPFILFGLIQSKNRGKPYILFLFWLVLAPLAATFADETPHAGRTLILLPPFLFFASLGIHEAIFFFKKRWVKIFVLCFICLAVLYNGMLYVHDYYLYYPEMSEMAWQGEMKEPVEFAFAHKDQYERTYITDKFGQTYMFYVWYNNIHPKDLQAFKKDFAKTGEKETSFHMYGNVGFVPITDGMFSCMLSDSRKSLIIVDKDLMKETLKPVYTFYEFNRFHEKKPTMAAYENTTLTKEQKTQYKASCLSQKDTFSYYRPDFDTLEVGK